MLYAVDINTLTRTKQTPLNRQVNSIDADDYYNINNYMLKNNLYTFFLSMADKKQYPVYYQQYNSDGNLVKEAKLPIQF